MVSGTDWMWIGIGVGALVLLSDVGTTVEKGGIGGLVNGTENYSSDTHNSSWISTVWNNPLNIAGGNLGNFGGWL